MAWVMGVGCVYDTRLGMLAAVSARRPNASRTQSLRGRPDEITDNSAEANVDDDDQTKALLAILKLGEIEIREDRFRDVDEFLVDLEKDGDAHGGE